MRRWHAVVATTLCVALAFAPLPARAQDAPDDNRSADADDRRPPKLGSLQGQVRAGAGFDGVLVGARVLAFHIGEQRTYASTPVAADGKYRIDDLRRGYYDLAVEVGSDVYVASEVLQVAPGRSARLDFELGPYPGGSPPTDRERFLGLDTPGAGLARTSRRLRGRDFWTSPRGIAIVGGVGGAALLAIALSDDDELAASPITP